MIWFDLTLEGAVLGGSLGEKSSTVMLAWKSSLMIELSPWSNATGDIAGYPVLLVLEPGVTGGPITEVLLAKFASLI